MSPSASHRPREILRAERIQLRDLKQQFTPQVFAVKTVRGFLVDDRLHRSLRHAVRRHDVTDRTPAGGGFHDCAGVWESLRHPRPSSTSQTSWRTWPMGTKCSAPERMKTYLNIRARLTVSDPESG